MLNGGGLSLENLRQVRRDTALRDLLGLDRIQSSDAVGNWLRRMGMSGGLYGLDQVIRKVLTRSLRDDGHESYTLDMKKRGALTLKIGFEFFVLGLGV